MSATTASALRVRPLAEDDWSTVRGIYAAGIATGNATFESEPPTWAVFDAGKLPGHRFVAVDAHAAQPAAPELARAEPLGWVAGSAVSDRCVYAGVVEVSVYVAAAARGRGVGRHLLEAFVASTEAAGIWTIQAGVFPENTASVALHCAAGFREVGTRSRLAEMSHGPHAGRWRDVLLLERRSTLVGA